MSIHFSLMKSWLIVAAILPAVAIGCHNTSEPDHNHADHDHLEHHVPHHKPANLAAAAKELPQRWRKLQRTWETAEQETRLHSLEELIDIVRWLPEMAGDSDMEEEPWNRVNALSRRLLASLSPVHAALSAGESAPLPSLAESQAFLDELAQLAPLATGQNQIPVEHHRE